MQKRTQILEILADYEVHDSDSSWTVIVPTASDCFFEIVIPKDVNEWFVQVYKNGTKNEFWSGWTDWYLEGEVNKSNVENYFQRDIEYFIQRIVRATDFRVIKEPFFKILGREFLKAKDLEAYIDGEWVKIEPGDFPEEL